MKLNRVERRVRRGVAGPSQLPSGAPAVVTKSLYQSASKRTSRGADDGSANMRSQTVYRRQTASIMSATGPVTRVHPSNIIRPQTPPDGQFYVRNGKLRPLLSDGTASDSSDSDGSDERASPNDHAPITATQQPLYRRNLALKHVTANIRTSRLQLALKKTIKSHEGNVGDSSEKISVPSNALRSPEIIDDSESEEDAEEMNIIIISSDAESSTGSTEDDTAGLVAALSNMSFPARLHLDRSLPFLVRNLRRSFLDHCRMRGIVTDPKTVPDPALRITYRVFKDDDAWEEFDGTTTDWRCPLCNLHGIFNTRELLECHVRMDHTEVQSVWSTNKTEGWSLRIEWASSDRLEVNGSSAGEASSFLHGAEERITAEIVLDAGLHTELDLPLSQVSITTPDLAPQTLPRLKCEEEPQPILEDIKPLRFDREAFATLCGGDEPPAPPRTGIMADGRPAPPPIEAKWGPAAEPPMHSCRPGGPRIYDLLKELPLEPFGLLAWSIIDREEDIFEQEDLRDEDKAMFALWNRWMMLNRVAFVFQDRLTQMKAFLDEYYLMIHRVAGWEALRLFLLLLSANKYLSVNQVSKALKHYEKLTRMSTWYHS